jgi:hypothetical protein
MHFKHLIAANYSDASVYMKRLLGTNRTFDKGVAGATPLLHPLPATVRSCTPQML